MAQSPPKDLKFVDDHWTAWDPPASIEEGAEVHIIERGDTLWDLAERFFGDPYLWPQIWERNQYILDAHWIYPGDPLVLGFEVESAQEVLGEPEDALADVEETDESLLYGPGGRSRFVQLGTPDDIYCSGYVGELDEEFGYRIVGSEYEVLAPSMKLRNRGKQVTEFGVVDAVKLGMNNGDIVYLDGGRAAGMAPGDRFMAVEPGPVVQHPLEGKAAGRFYQHLGLVRVLSVQDDSAIAEVARACTAIDTGSVLKPFVEEPIPSERKTPMRPVNQPHPTEAVASAPMILYAKDGVVSLGEDHVVFVELGEMDDVIPGDQFTIYRQNRGDNPPVVLGELAILSVHPRSSVAKITESRYPIYVGDRLIAK
jgi:hypothetical protein